MKSGAVETCGTLHENGTGGTDHGRMVAYAGTHELGAVVVQALERAATVAALAVIKELVRDYRSGFESASSHPA